MVSQESFRWGSSGNSALDGRRVSRCCRCGSRLFSLRPGRYALGLTHRGANRIFRRFLALLGQMRLALQFPQMLFESSAQPVGGSLEFRRRSPQFSRQFW